MNLFSRKTPSKKKGQSNKEFFIQQIVEENYKNRLWITIIVMVTFLILISGIGYAMYANTPISKDWKEVLLLMLGVFTGSYNQIIHFWFKNEELQRKMLQLAEEEDDKANQDDEDGEDNKKQLLKG